VSEKILKKVAFNNKFDLADDFISTVLKFAIPHAVSDIDCYWRTSDAEKIISDVTFGYIWDNYPDTRNELLNVVHNVASKHTRIKSLSKDFCTDVVKRVYSNIEDNESLEDNRLKVRLLPVVDPLYDYLDKMCKFALDSEKENLFTIWRQAGLSSSTDEAFFDYLWSKVKREKGSVNIKINILDNAFDNEAVSDSLLKKIAKSSPKNIKRLATSKLSGYIADQKHRIRKFERDNTKESLATAAFLQEKVAKVERKAMLFVDCTDREVVSNLLDCLSKDNLPWLMPSASKHYYLSRRLQDMIEAE